MWGGRFWATVLNTEISISIPFLAWRGPSPPTIRLYHSRSGFAWIKYEKVNFFDLFLTPGRGKLNPCDQEKKFLPVHFFLYFYFFIFRRLFSCTNAKTLQVPNIIGLFLCIWQNVFYILCILPFTSEWGRAKPEPSCCCRDLVVRTTENKNRLSWRLPVPHLLTRDRWLFCHLSWFKMTDWC